jgi:hypothetical protein
MKAIRKISKLQRGQAIVIFTVALGVILMLMAVVLDGGVLLLRRREAQAAADAGALRGVLHLCGTLDDPTGAALAAKTDGENYATVNNLATTALGIPNAAAHTLRVDTVITQTPALAGLMGFGPIDVQATATAICLPAGSGTAVMPFVFACEPPEGVAASDSEDCVEKIWGDDLPAEALPPADPTPSDTGPFYLVHNSDPADEDLHCIDPPNSDPANPTATDPPYSEGAWDCDFDNDGIDDIIDSANKGWISLESGTNPGASILIDWILNGFDGEITTHVWAGGSPGVADSIFQAIGDLEDPEFPIVFIPVFNSVCNESGDPEVECPTKYHETPVDPIDDETLSISGAQKYYHIIGFAAFQITCVYDLGNSSCPMRNAADINAPSPNDFVAGTPKTVEGYFVPYIDPDLGGGPGFDTGTYITRLIN